MLPHLGAGAGQGLEDVCLLVKLLSHAATTSANIDVRIFSCLGSTLLESYASRVEYTRSIRHGPSSSREQCFAGKYEGRRDIRGIRAKWAVAGEHAE